MAVAIILSLISILAGVGVSWIFFRTQQQINFERLQDQQYINLNRLQEHVSDISEHMRSIKMIEDLRNDVSHMKEVRENISRIRESISKIDRHTSELKQNILTSIQKEHNNLKISFYRAFETRILESKSSMENSIENKLLIPTKNIPERQRKAAVNILKELYLDTVNKIEKFQQKTLEDESVILQDKVEKTVVGAIEKLSKEIDDIKEKVESLSL